MARPVRKDIRLPEYDYAQPGAYFVTICTRMRENLFWTDADKTLIEGDPPAVVALREKRCCFHRGNAKVLSCCEDHGIGCYAKSCTYIDPD